MDQIADLLTRIRNGSTARHSVVEIPSSRMKVEIARLMTEQGYVVGYKVAQGEHGQVILVELKYGKNRERVISGIKRVSKPGRRVYAKKESLPKVLGGLGTAIISTSRGLVTSAEARKQGLGGEVICFIW